MLSLMYLISADKETMEGFVYDELLNHTGSSQIAYKSDMRDGTEGLYIHVNDNYRKSFVEACNAYGVTIRWNEKEAA
ncbi:MAG: hypothetical protein J6U54_10940 [Clostridiales bacterium]|nr:hypothetical protein [Clostridiales bacterium]